MLLTLVQKKPLGAQPLILENAPYRLRHGPVNSKASGHRFAKVHDGFLSGNRRGIINENSILEPWKQPLKTRVLR